MKDSTYNKRIITIKMTTVAFIIPTTTRGCSENSMGTTAVIPSIFQTHLVRILFKSFMETYTSKYKYKFYLGIDEDDVIYSQQDQRINLFNWIKSLASSIPSLKLNLEFIVMKDIPKGHLTKMWNCLFKKAYDDGCNYFFLSGDDIQLMNSGWIEKAIQLLNEHHDIGFTGPTNCNGNTNIITQTFVSRKHYEIFGYAFPEDIWNWYCDDWINIVYTPDYIYRMDNYKCYNQGGRERYKIVEAKILCQKIAKDDKLKLEKYITKIKS